MITDILLSIIIPAYNVEAYIKECLDSIFQSLKDLDINQVEVIVVDDASCDNTQNILKSYFAMNLTVVANRTNEGISNARNTGISIAHGKYIMLMDSDDFLVPNTLEQVLDFLKSHDTIDIVEFGYYELEEGATRLKNRTEIHTVTSGVGQSIFAQWVRNDCFNALVWNKIVRRSLIVDNSIYFYPNISYEDEEWVPRIFAYANEVVFLPLNVYVYRRRKGSITRSGQTAKYYDMAKICDSLVLFANTQGFSKEYSIALKRCASNIYWEMFRGIKQGKQYDDNAINMIDERRYLVEYSKNLKRKWFYGYILKIMGAKRLYFLRYALKDFLSCKR